MISIPRLSIEQTIERVLANGITYCATGEKLSNIADAVKDVAGRKVPGIYLEAGVALGGSAIVIAASKPVEEKLLLFDLFEMLPPPGEGDELRAHEIYGAFVAGNRTDPIDVKYLTGVKSGLLGVVQLNMETHGVDPLKNNILFFKGDFKNTLHINEPIAFAHIDCDWYAGIALCLERIADRISPGGVIVFDDYKSFSGAARAVDEWLARDSRFAITKISDNVLVQRLVDTHQVPVKNFNKNLPVLKPDGGKPRVLMLVDRPAWAYDAAARAISQRLADEFEFHIVYVCDNPQLDAWPFDLIYVFFWGETYHQRFVRDPSRVIKEISSHRWENEDVYGKLSAEQACKRYLEDAGTLTATSQRLRTAFLPYRDVHWCPNGFDTDLFGFRGGRQGGLRIGWAGNQNDPCKGLRDIILPAIGSDFDFLIAGGSLNQSAMSEFYNSIDVLCIASIAEGEPLTLIEGMASGNFLVAVDVGVVPELVQHGDGGLVVERSVAAFRAAFQWCRQNINTVRAGGEENARRLAAERKWDDVASHWRTVFRAAYHGLSSGRVAQNTEVINYYERNLGVNLGQWPSRANAAAQAIADLSLPLGASLIDMGCGHQTLRSLLPSALTYVPVDRIARAEGVQVMDFDCDLPVDRHTIATFLGVFEYFSDPTRFIQWASTHVRYLIFSYNDCSDPARCETQHWRSRLSFEELERSCAKENGTLIKRLDLGRAEFLYVVEFVVRVDALRIQWDASSAINSPSIAPSYLRTKKIALLSAGVGGDNSGDALIVDAIRRLLSGHDSMEFPLLTPLTSEQLALINTCDAAIICGTNLYQHVFACGLTADVISRIHIPIIPIGVGSSAPIGRLPVMDSAGINAVRMIHDRCTLGSVRDPLTLEFIRSIGIQNVELTGCPVLFHGGDEPRFIEHTNGAVALSVRARLLHVDEAWNFKQVTTLRRVCSEFHPSIFMQSPYDLKIGDELSKEFNLDRFYDARWGAGPMIEAVKRASRTIGFRLHFGMLSLSYGRPATFLATDTRTSSFCDMVGIPYHRVETYRDEDILAEMSGPQAGHDRFIANWRSLRQQMASLLTANGLSHTLNSSV